MKKNVIYMQKEMLFIVYDHVNRADTTRTSDCDAYDGYSCFTTPLQHFDMRE